MKGIKLWQWTAAALVAGLCFLTACEETPPPQNAPTVASPVAREAAAEKPAARWPPVATEGIEIAANLLAKNYYVILDGSGSMTESGCSGGLDKMSVAKTALQQFSQLVPDDANLGLMLFMNNQLKELVKLGRGADNKKHFKAAVDAAGAGGTTPLLSAITAGYQRLTSQATGQRGYGEYTLVIVTDGAASPGEDPTPIVEKILSTTPIEIHTIGFCIGTNHVLNIPGRTVYKAADNPAALQQGLEAVLAESEVFDLVDFGPTQ